MRTDQQRAEHAEAETLTIGMDMEREWITVRVEDDGKGFDTEAEAEGMGLSNIASRISSIRGELRIDSRPNGGGTRVSSASIPNNRRLSIYGLPPSRVGFPNGPAAPDESSTATPGKDPENPARAEKYRQKPIL
ncbi:sensor histidine kinase [Rikenella microfusus]|uniref:sensor histidine kinase n=1 Tax=Rikenella microfusus TaxID=28139 RepID=UPI0011C07E98|nr:ATP-binding protein [Rikenella microfusus]